METKANILRIEKISPTDGEGLRTVVFFKGCPLRCAWCSTPESQRAEPELYYQRNRCVSCGRCAAACPEGALSLGEDGRVRRDRERCKDCFHCADVCPTRSLQIYGKEMTVKQVLREILKDEVFYFHSGGGVTLSGGDVLCYPDFAEELLRECKEAAINTSAELDMYGPYGRIERLLPWLDTFFADLKLMDPGRHKKWTGVSNEPILENLIRASRQCRKNAIHIRVPLIWDINDDRENILAAARFCSTLENCAELEFLPYHRLGQHSYEYLGRDYALEKLPAMNYEDAFSRVSFLRGESWHFPIRISGRLIAPAE